jgi:GTPase SAR1 family protein
MTTTKRLSDEGKTQVEQARTHKGWIQDDPRWLRIATEFANPEPIGGWKSYYLDNPEPFSPSRSTLKNRFLKQKNIRHESFVALCQAVGVRWEEVADLDNLAAGEPPQSVPFFGRNTALKQLSEWIEQGHCRLILLHGRAGIGKTAIANRLLQKNQTQQQNSIAPIWLSLETAMPMAELVNQIIEILSEDQVQQGSLTDLMSYLRQKPHLIVLDQWETILENSSQNRYRSGYEDYQLLLDYIGQNHQSCFIIISREKFQCLKFTQMKKVAKSFEVTGLNYQEDRDFLKAEGLTGTEEELQQFIEIYNNPLILQLIADRIRTVHGGRVAPLVAKDVSVLSNSDIVKVIKDEFEALGTLEKSIVYWLAIWRNPINIEQLEFSFGDNFRMSMVTEALNFLINQRSFVKVNAQSEYYLEPVTLKEITNLFVRNVVEELVDLVGNKNDLSTKLIESHLFVIGDDENINNEQTRRIVQSIIEQSIRRLPFPVLTQKLLSLSHGYSSNNLQIMTQVHEI